jgi:hypothetical protein
VRYLHRTMAGAQLSGKRSDLQRALDAIDAKIATLQAVRAELLAVQKDKPKRKAKADPAVKP